MDIDYLMAREQISLERSISSPSAEARIAHAGLARCYGDMLASHRFPHRVPGGVAVRREPATEA